MRTTDQLTARLNFYCQVIIVLLMLCVVRLWSLPPMLDPASAAGGAGIPDAGAQRATQIAEARRTNQTLDAIETLLRTGPLPVRVVEDPATGEQAQSSKR